MKYQKTTLKLFLVLALAFIFAPYGFASEVTGTLSSNGVFNQGASTEGTVSGTVSSTGSGGGNRTISGTVQAVIADSGSGTSNLNSLSADGMALVPGSGNLAFNFSSANSSSSSGSGSEEALEASPETTDVASAFPNSSDLTASTADVNPGNSMWIILLSLLLIATPLYIYMRMYA